MSSYTLTEFIDDLPGTYFVPADQAEWLRDEAIAHDCLGALSRALIPFHATRCPNCGAVGLFRWAFLGHLTHDCGASWHVSTWAYFARQVGRSVGWGKSFAIESATGSDDDGSLGAAIAGLFIALIGFVLGVSIRLPFGLLMTPIQGVVKLTSRPSLPDAVELCD